MDFFIQLFSVLTLIMRIKKIVQKKEHTFRLFKKFNALNCLYLMNGLLLLWGLYTEISNLVSINLKNEIANDIEIIYESHYNYLKWFYHDKVIIVLKPNANIVKHLNFALNTAVFILLNNNKVQSTACRLDEIEQFISQNPKDSLYAITDQALFDEYHIIKDNSEKCYIYEDLLSNYFFNEKVSMIKNIYKKIQKLLKQQNHLPKYFEPIGIRLYKNSLLNTISLNIFPEDDFYLINSYPNENYEKSANVILKYFYQDLAESFTNYMYRLKSNNKIDSTTNLIENIFLLMIKYGIMKKQINIEYFPEIIPILFPTKFICEGNDKARHYDLIRFCLSFKDVKYFYKFYEYFDEKKVNELLQHMPFVYFSEFFN